MSQIMKNLFFFNLNKYIKKQLLNKKNLNFFFYKMIKNYYNFHNKKNSSSYLFSTSELVKLYFSNIGYQPVLISLFTKK